MKKMFWLLAILFCLGYSVKAQEQFVKGTVTDIYNQPIENVVITIRKLTN